MGRVAEDGGVVGVHADAVAEHLLLVVEVGVGAEVVGEVHLLVHWARAGGTRGGGAGAVREGRHWVEAGARGGFGERDRELLCPLVFMELCVLEGDFDECQPLDLV